MTNDRVYLVDGKEFKSLLSVANAYNVRYPLLNYHTHKLGNVEDALDYIISEEYAKNKSKYTVYGVEYPSITQIAVAFGITNRQLLYNSKRLGSITKALEYCLGTEIEYEGKKYHNLCDLCSHFNISASTCLGRLNAGWNLENALKIPVTESSTKYKEVIFRGKLYNSVAALGREYGVDSRIIYNFLEINEHKYVGLDIEDSCDVIIGFLEEQGILGKFYINRMPSVLYDGKLFSTYAEFSKYIGVHTTLWFEYRRKYKGLDVLKTASVIKSQTVYEYEYQGKKYTITELKKLLGYSYHRVMTLVRHNKVRRYLVPKYHVHYNISSQNKDLTVEFESYLEERSVLKGRRVQYA